MAYKNKETALKNLTKYDFYSPKFDNFRDDKDVVLEAIKKTHWALSLASDRLKDDEELVLEAIKQKNSETFEFASDRLKDDKNIVLEAVRHNFNALNFASDRLKDDKNIVLEAVKQKYWALKFASKRLQDDIEIVLEAVKQDGFALRDASDRLKDNEDVVLAAIRNIELFCNTSKTEINFNFASERIKKLLENETDKIAALEAIIAKPKLEESIKQATKSKNGRI